MKPKLFLWAAVAIGTVVLGYHTVGASPIIPFVATPTPAAATMSQMDKNWNLSGTIQEMNGEFWDIQGFVVQVTTSTHISGVVPSVGSYVHATGVVQPDGTWLATVIHIGNQPESSEDISPTATVTGTVTVTATSTATTTPVATETEEPTEAATATGTATPPPSSTVTPSASATPIPPTATTVPPTATETPSSPTATATVGTPSKHQDDNGDDKGGDTHKPPATPGPSDHHNAPSPSDSNRGLHLGWSHAPGLQHTSNDQTKKGKGH